MPFNGFRGTVGGSVQTAYTDQPGLAMPGMLAFASDINLCDAVYVGEADGIASGAGVIFTDVVDAISLQRPNLQAVLPDETASEADFAGIVAFSENMQSNDVGAPGWNQGRIASVLRNVRAGGRIYVKMPVAVDHTADSVYWVTLGGTDEAFETGGFSPAALAGSALAGYTIALTKVRWVSSCDAGSEAILEFLGDLP